MRGVRNQRLIKRRVVEMNERWTWPGLDKFPDLVYTYLRLAEGLSHDDAMQVLKSSEEKE